MDDVDVIRENKEYLTGLLNDIQGICDEIGTLEEELAKCKEDERATTEE